MGDTIGIHGNSDPFGKSTPAHADGVYTYLSNLQVFLDGTPVTTEILNQLGGTPRWGSLGDGTPIHAINITNIATPGSRIKPGGGTGPIDLLRAAEDKQATLDQGSHFLEFSVADGGGKLIYNLYIA
jgi:hypothetical protein